MVFCWGSELNLLSFVAVMTRNGTDWMAGGRGRAERSVPSDDNKVLSIRSP